MFEKLCVKLEVFIKLLIACIYRIFLIKIIKFDEKYKNITIRFFHLPKKKYLVYKF